MGLPNLIGCGAGKSGTTSLYYYLSLHPDIFMAPAKEIHYFSQNYNNGTAWYEKHFSNSEDEKILGEFSTSYMLDENVPERIFDLIPRAKLLFLFRDPISRAYSNYWFSVNIGEQPPGEDFSEAIRTKLGAERYLKAGYYHQHLTRFLAYFNRDQIHIIISEELRTDPSQQMRDCFHFLGVDPHFEADFNQAYNRTVISSSKWKLALDQGWLKTKASIKPLFYWVPQSFRRNFSETEQKIRKFLNAGEKPAMAEADQQYLEELYAPSNQKLAEYLGRDLPW